MNPTKALENGLLRPICQLGCALNGNGLLSIAITTLLTGGRSVRIEFQHWRNTVDDTSPRGITLWCSTKSHALQVHVHTLSIVFTVFAMNTLPNCSMAKKAIVINLISENDERQPNLIEEHTTRSPEIGTQVVSRFAPFSRRLFGRIFGLFCDTRPLILSTFEAVRNIMVRSSYRRGGRGSSMEDERNLRMWV